MCTLSDPRWRVTCVDMWRNRLQNKQPKNNKTLSSIKQRGGHAVYRRRKPSSSTLAPSMVRNANAVGLLIALFVLLPFKRVAQM